MKLRLEVEIDTENTQDAEAIRRLVEQLETILEHIEELKGYDD